MNISFSFSSDCQVLQFAAEELERYFLKMNPLFCISHNTLEMQNHISLFVNPKMDISCNTQLDDSFQITISHLHGSIIGSNPRSVLLGVYKYLYLLGCRFLRPGETYELVPSYSKAEDFNASAECVADLRHRGVCIEGADSFENIIDFIDWLPKLGYNSFFIQFKIPYSFMNLWYSHKNNPCLAKESFSMENAIDFSQKIDSEMKKRGLLHHRVGHGWTGEVLGVSSLGWSESTVSIDNDTKKLLALVDGKRDLFHNIPTNTNLCYSNPMVITSFTERVVTYAKEHTDVNYLHIWLADELNNHCECHHCKDKLVTDQYINILNAIDESFTANQLSTRIVFLLYHELLWPSVNETLVNPERFVLMFAPITRTFDYSFKDRKESAPIPSFKRNQISTPSGLEENLAFLKEWQKIFTGDSFDYDYPLGRAHYGDPGYVAISRTLYEDIHQLKQLNLNGYLSCQELRCFLPNALPNYVMGMSLFNQSLTFDEIAEDYYKHAYGQNWSNCFHYLDTLSSFYSCDYFNKIGDRVNYEFAEKLKKALSHIRAFQPLLQGYLQESTGLEHRFFKHLDYHSEYSILLTEALYHLASDNHKETIVSWNAFLSYIRSNEVQYQECLDVYRIIEVATKYTGFPSISNG